MLHYAYSGEVEQLFPPCVSIVVAYFFEGE